MQTLAVQTRTSLHTSMEMIMKSVLTLRMISLRFSPKAVIFSTCMVMTIAEDAGLMFWSLETVSGVVTSILFRFNFCYSQ